MAPIGYSGVRGILILEKKTWSRTSRDTLPLTWPWFSGVAAGGTLSLGFQISFNGATTPQFTSLVLTTVRTFFFHLFVGTKTVFYNFRSPGIDSDNLCSLCWNLEQSMRAGNRVGKDCRTGPPGYTGWRNRGTWNRFRLIPWNRFLGFLKV